MTSVSFGPILESRRGKKHGRLDPVSIKSASPLKYISLLEHLYTKWEDELNNTISSKRLLCIEDREDSLHCMVEMDDNLPSWKDIFERVRTTTQGSSNQSIIGIAFPVSPIVYRHLGDQFGCDRRVLRNSTFRIIDRLDQKTYISPSIHQRLTSAYHVQFGQKRESEALVIFVESEAMAPRSDNVFIDDFFIYDPHILFINPDSISWSE